MIIIDSILCKAYGNGITLFVYCAAYILTSYPPTHQKLQFYNVGISNSPITSINFSIRILKRRVVESARSGLSARDSVINLIRISQLTTFYQNTYQVMNTVSPGLCIVKK